MQVLGWMCSVAVALTTLYARYGEMTSPGDWNAGQRAAFETGSRIGWALSVCWVILVCATGSGGLVNSVLSWEGWLPLSRLTFGAYLIHILVMVYDVNTHRVRGYITLYYIISKFFGFCTATYLFAFVNALVVEAPLLGIEKILLKKR
ncbi:nose resistant to fluoxetine protein 6-like [Gigantopelta aegis]|uniref:nose resistant to fluoxetine protein 6-like n=1 Tax=Gigantopelta aegis TaxID=1735272 RepID=UPI001B88D4B9|nr:nose resistant to fluoxetine protein 6-like [Gigantopelta aegis]